MSHKVTAVQNSALTVYEAFCIQLSVLAQAHGIPCPTFPKPADHNVAYTFKIQLPLSSTHRHEESQLIIDPDYLVLAASPGSQSNTESNTESNIESNTKLEISCSLCPCSAQTYQIPAKIWAHIQRCHEDDKDASVMEARRIGTVFENFKRSKDNVSWQAPPRSKLWNRLEQLRRPGFDWTTFTE